MQTLTTPERTTPAADGRSASLLSPGLVALEGGATHRGMLRGAGTSAEGDLIFTTAATGWGEILTDPSYAGQMVVLTHPMAGSYRIDPGDLESSRVHARALIVTRLVVPPAGPGLDLEGMARDAGIPILTGVDTRALTLELRRGAARRAVVRRAAGGATPAVAAARASAAWESVDHVAAVATEQPFHVPPVGERRLRVVLIDYGVKRSLLAALAARGAEIVGLPPGAAADDVAAIRPDLVVLSPGPGDPARMERQIAVVRQLSSRAIAGGPRILGICLGHQLLALAAGCQTQRLSVGHHGGNHAVIEVATGRVDIGAHNHEVAVLARPELAAAGFAISHRDLNDDTVEGLVHRSGRIASVQFHPEGAPGPTDGARVLDAAIQAATR